MTHLEGDWRIMLCNVDGVPLRNLAPVAYDRTGSWKLNRPATLTFKVPSNDPRVNTIHSDGFPLLEPQTRTVKAYQRTGAATYTLRFTGWVWDVQDDSDADGQMATTVTCIDPLQILTQRDVVNAALDGFPDYADAPGHHPSWFTATQATTIVKTIIDRTNSHYGTCGITTTSGTFDTTATRIIPNPPDLMIWGTIVYLMEAIDGFDLKLDYLDQTDGVLARINCLSSRGTNKPAAVFNWGAGKNNCSRIRRLQQGQQLANSGFAWGGEPGGASQIHTVEENSASITAYRRRRAVRQHPEITAQTFLDAILDDDIAWRKSPRESVEVFPVKDLAPDPWTDFDLGDTITVNVGADLRGGFTGLQRVYGWEIEMGDVEKVTKILTKPDE